MVLTATEKQIVFDLLFVYKSLDFPGSNQMTVGKIYCAKLIYENYKHLKKQGKEET